MVDAGSDDAIYTVTGNEIQGSYTSAASGATTANASTPGAVISATSGGIKINLILDAAAQAAPDSFKNGLQQAAAILAANITDQITVNINIDYSGTGGGAAAGPDQGLLEPYTWVRSTLINNASPGDTTFNSLPNTTTIQGQSQVAVWNAQLKLWGKIAANDTTTDDASATFATDINPNLLVGVALHEFTHAWGRVPYGPPYGSQPDIFDLYRFTSPGVILIDGRSKAASAYFSLDGGNTKLADYGVSSDPSDFLNSGVQGPNDPFDEFYSSSTIQGLTALDLKQLDAVGYHLAINAPTTIEAYGSTALVQVGSNYFMNPTAGGAGPELKYNGSAVSPGMFGLFAPVGAEQVSGGYDVAWKDPSTGVFSFWSVDANGNYLSTFAANVAGNSATVMSLELTFQQDLNGDGTIGPIPVTIEAAGSTKLVQVGSNYDLISISTGTGPVLKFNGSAVTPGMFGLYTPVGAEQVSGGGYDVAWKNPSTGTFSFWNVDANGNYLSTFSADVAGNSAAVMTLETTFHQDLNGDGVTGFPSAGATTVIDTAGVTNLTQVGNNYFFYHAGSGPELMRGGVAVAVNQFAPFQPIGAEQTSTGYDLAWKVTGADQYIIWAVDSAGNFVQNLTDVISGSSTTLESYENVLHQDLNGDGIVGVPGGGATTVIDSAGTTYLTQVGSNYFFYHSGAGPELMRGGVAVAANQFAPFQPIGAEQTTTGYDLAWKVAGADQYIIWAVDSAGNFVQNLTDVISGSNTTLETYENVFHQDLNGDGITGIPGGGATTVIEAFGSTSLTQIGANFYFLQNGAGPELMRGGAPVVANQFAPFVPIGAEKTATGYDLAWKVAGADQYIIWNVDNNGNFVANLTDVVSGSSSTLKSYESIFHQDLNGDGIISPAGGSTAPTAAATDQMHAPTIGSPAAQLADLLAQDSWNFNNNNGNVIANLIGAATGSSGIPSSFEPIFHQDPNGDGTIGHAASPAGPSAAAMVAVIDEMHAASIGSPATQLADLLAHDFIIR
jgi:hypothetical protein